VRELRELVRYRAKLVALRTGLKAQVKAVLAKHGLHPPVEDLWGLAGTAYLNGLELDDGYHTKVESLRDLVEAFDREVAMLERNISDSPRPSVGGSTTSRGAGASIVATVGRGSSWAKDETSGARAAAAGSGSVAAGRGAGPLRLTWPGRGLTSKLAGRPACCFATTKTSWLTSWRR
jgi:transposase